MSAAVVAIAPTAPAFAADAWPLGDKELDSSSASLSIISKGPDGTATSEIIEDGAIQKYLDTVEVDKAAESTEAMAVDDAPAATDAEGDVQM